MNTRMHIIVHKTKSRIMNEGVYDKISVSILKKSKPAASDHSGSTLSTPNTVSLARQLIMCLSTMASEPDS